MQEDILCSNPLPGYGKVESLCELLTELACEDGHRLSIKSDTRSDIKKRYEDLEEHDKSASRFVTAYQARWGHSLYGRTKGDANEAVLTQRTKLSQLKCSAAQHIDPMRNRLVYTLIKQLWLYVSVICLNLISV